MPKICRGVDGHLFIRRGLFGQDEEDIPCATYQVGPKGEQVFDYLRAQDGDDVGLQLFYALLLDGGIFHPGTPDDVSVYDLPEKFGPSSVSEGEDQWTTLARVFATTPRLSLKSMVDFLDSIEPKKRLSPKEVVECAVTLYLAAKVREEADRRKHGT